ncbi:MAG: undecaprenyl-diphosphate phosphatase [Deltaproteobacteria bacterium]|nr:undecaprenyl-diphosphate phosphatase [Deltaproteobacteria bacterium]
MMLAVILLAVLEGLTEFLPVSSTGHLVVASGLLGFSPAWREPFLVVIQFGAVLAVIVDRFTEIRGLAQRGLDPLAALGTKLVLAFIPSAVLGLLLHDLISGLLKNPEGVCAAWILGGIAILVLDRPSRPGLSSYQRVTQLDQVTTKQAVAIGFAQCLSLWPGMSRSASTILGGLAVRLDRPTATLFSFYLAIPTMTAASAYELLKFRDELDGAGASFVVGMIVSFGVAWLTVRWLLRFVQTHTFRSFAIYRIVAGVALFLVPGEWWQD